MKLSRKFVSDYIDLDKNLSIKKIADDMTSVGNEYDAASPLIPCSNLVIGEVVESRPHPDSDHLHVCKVNIGKEILTIVCGAPNVREGLKVIVALNGAHLPLGEIKKSVIRGVESNGMLCSMAELGLDSKFLTDKDRNGIHELSMDAVVGKEAISFLELDDEVIDFELTANRGDLLSILGMAYELGAIYKKKVKDIDLSHQEIGQKVEDELKLSIETKACSLFLAKKVTNVVIKESPAFIKNRLIASGIRPINNVVDISNYVMLETGQPLHFYDADRLGDTLAVRMAKEKEKLCTLDGVERVLSSDDIVITNGKEAIGLAGVMGGLSTEVEEDTKNIVIESAIFDGVTVRKTSKKILRSEASNRFEKGLDPKRTYMAIERSCHLLEKYADATILSGMLVYDETNKEDKEISITCEKINHVLGITISLDEVLSIFSDLGFKTEKNKDEIKVFVPTRRLDITIAEDLIEEVGRMYGMDRIEGKLPILNVVTGTFNKTKRAIKDKLVSLGLNETCSYSLISHNDIKSFTTDTFTEIMLNDPMSEDKNTLRYSLLPSLKEIYLYNKARNCKNLSIFEMGKGFYQENGVYKEELRLAVLMSGDYYLGIKNTKVDFYVIKGLLEELLDYLGYQNRYQLDLALPLPAEMHPGQSAKIILQGKEVGLIGKVHPNTLKDDVYVFELNLDQILKNKGTRMQYKEIPKYPGVEKDMAFLLAKEIRAEEVISIIKKQAGKLLSNIEVFDVYEGKNVKEDEKSIAFKLTFMDPSKTLTEEEVMEVFYKIVEKVEKSLPAKLRDK